MVIDLRNVNMSELLYSLHVDSPFSLSPFLFLIHVFIQSLIH